jgi:hypothetical protein
VSGRPHNPLVSMIYRPYWERGPNSLELMARAAGDPRSIGGTMLAAIHNADGDTPKVSAAHHVA